MNIKEARAKSKAISKELRLISDKLKSEAHPNYHNEARSIINKKYGKGWREELMLISGDDGTVNAYY